MRVAQNETLRKREQLREEQKLGTLIRLLTERPQEELDLQTLPCPTEGQITEHYAIQIYSLISFCMTGMRSP
jgi:hypothetical protein